MTFEGEADAAAIARHYDSADLFVLPTLYEGYGMAVAEALARGLPVVSTTTGAIPDIVPEHAGVLVPPDDVSALTAALASMLQDPSRRRRLAEGARRARARLPTWPMAAAKMGVTDRVGCEWVISAPRGCSCASRSITARASARAHEPGCSKRCGSTNSAFSTWRAARDRTAPSGSRSLHPHLGAERANSKT